jgi:hypothetical protein
VVRNGKGDKDRITVLPHRGREELREQIERVRRQHQRDLDAGFGTVYLPHALERKYPNENRKFGWQWIFPSHQLSKVKLFRERCYAIAATRLNACRRSATQKPIVAT